MSEKKTKKDKKTRKLPKFDVKTWAFVSVAVVAFMLVVAAIVNFGQTEKIESDYFHDSDGKIVLTMNKEMAALDNSEYEPFITHVVYYYNGNNITEVKAFFEYPDENTARQAYENLGLGDFADSKRLNGRFVEFQVKRAQYDGVSLDELKSDIETMKEIDALILDYNEKTIKKYVVLETNEEETEVEENSENSESESDSDSNAGAADSADSAVSE